MDDGNSLASNVISDIAEGAQGATSVIAGEFTKLGKSAASQISPQSQPQQSSDDITQLAKEDKEFSKKEAAVVQGNINRIYQEYAAKRAKEQKQQEMAQNQQDVQRNAQIEEIKKQQAINPAIAKSRAEIKNYGAE